jgi:4-hydroxybenzoate polyprenyltransferase
MRDYLKLLRVKHYIKNVLIFAALLFSGQILVAGKLRDCSIGFIAFCLVSSAIYIFNDIRDRKSDALHPKKKMRPIASGKISVKAAIITAVLCLVLACICFSFVFNVMALFFLGIYVIINLLYSWGLKNIPLVDVTILVLGFLIRVIYGAILSGIEVSGWLYLTVITFSFFLAFGKRRNEFKLSNSSDTRAVLKGYTPGFLDKSMYLCLAMANTFYALWTVGDSTTEHYNGNKIIFTVPIVLLISLKYCLNIEKEESDGDPTEVLFSDKALLVLCFVYAVIMGSLLYGGKIMAALGL